MADDRLRADSMAIILAEGYMGAEWQDLGPDEQDEVLDRMLEAVLRLEREGLTIVHKQEDMPGLHHIPQD